MLGKEANVLGVDIGGHAVHGVPPVAQAPALGLLGPGFIVAVAIEDDALMGLKGVVQQGLKGGIEVLGLL